MDQNSDLKLIILPTPLYTYLLHIFRRETLNGLIAPEELVAASELWKRLNEAKDIDFSKLGNVGVEKIGPNGVEFSLSQEAEGSQTSDRGPNPAE